MNNIDDFDQLDLTITKCKITTYIDTLTGAMLKSFHQRLTQRNVAKLYILKENERYLYVGTTMQSLTSRIRYGLAANGKTGYHGYKWKNKESVKLFVWCFDELNRIEIESVEAEFVFLVRKMTGLWPYAQNEIHFNNDFNSGKEIAEKLYKRSQ